MTAATLREFVLIDYQGRMAWVSRVSSNSDLPVVLPKMVRYSCMAILDRTTGEVIKDKGKFPLPLDLHSPDIPEAWPLRGRTLLGAAVSVALSKSPINYWFIIDYRAANGFALIPPHMLNHFVLHPDDQLALDLAKPKS